jgi:DNA polymerase-3 subunit epsilon
MRAPSAWAQDLLGRPETWAVLDTETTGGATPEIIEVAVVDGTGRTLLESYCRPTQAVTFYARQAHGISDHVLRRAVPFTAIYTELAAVLADRCIYAWNMGFDRSMVMQTCARYRLAPIATTWQCAMQAYRAYAGSRQPYNLAAACQALGVPAPSHRALRDVRATLNIIRAMAEVPPLSWDDDG